MIHMLVGARCTPTAAAQALAGAISQDRSLESLALAFNICGSNGFTDEAGVALAEALTASKNLRTFTLTHAMLRVNTSLVLKLPPFESAGGGDEGLVDSSRNQMRIEQELNRVGHGRLLSSRQTPIREWVDALHELDSSNVEGKPAFSVSCLYSSIRLNPATCVS
jgi:hypothetical protein